MTEAQLSRQTVSEIRKLSDVARASQNYLSLKEIILLTSTPLTEPELRDKWDSTPELSSNYKLQHDMLFDPGSETSKSANSLIAILKDKETRAQNYLESAKAFVAWTRDTSTRLISISGSTSYFSAGSSDDLDFFLVSANENLWITLFKSLILARIFRRLHPHTPRICLSYAVDEDFAEKTFNVGDPLLARDTLNLIVVRGEEYYHDLLGKNSWMGKYFPRLYSLKTKDYSSAEDSRKSTPSMMKKILNLLLYLGIGQYIRIKSNLLNRQFLREGRSQSLFALRTGPDHCIFDSNRYSKLRQIYNQANPISNGEQELGASRIEEAI